MLSLAQERLLRYWGLNMAIAMAQSRGAAWPLFGYSKAERARLEALAGAIPGKAMMTFFAVTVVVFIALAALAVVLVLLPLLGLIAPDPADLRPLPFVLAMALVILIALGLGFPVALGVGARLADAWAGGVPAAADPGDSDLYAKIRCQLLRFTLVAAAIFIPGCLLFILSDIEAGPLIDLLKLACAASALGGMAVYWWTRPKASGGRSGP